MLCAASSFINSEASGYYGRDTDQTTRAPKLPNAHHTVICLCKTNHSSTTLPLKKPCPNSSTADSIQRNYQTNRGNCLNNETQLLYFATLQH